MIEVACIIPELLYGGGENRLLNIIRSFDRDRFRVRVVVLFESGATAVSAFGDMRSEFEAAGVELVYLRIDKAWLMSRRSLKPVFTGVHLLRSVTRLTCHLASRRTDLVDVHLENAAIIAAPAAKLAGVPACVTLYNPDVVTPYFGRALILSHLLRNAAGVVTDSNSCAQRFSKMANIPAERIDIIPNGVHLGPHTRSRLEMLREWNIPDGAVVVGQVSGLVPYKGHSVLMAAARIVVNAMPNVYFLCCGFPRAGETFVNSLLGEARELGIIENVRIVSYAGHIADVWNAIDIQAHPSLIDSLPNAIVEGMSLAKPIVAAQVGGIPDVLHDGHSALLVPSGEVAPLAQALLRLLRAPPYAAELGRRARDIYLSSLTPEKMCRRIEMRWLGCLCSS